MLHSSHWQLSPYELPCMHFWKSNSLSPVMSSDFATCQAEGDFTSFLGPVLAYLGRHLEESAPTAPSFPWVSNTCTVNPTLPQNFTMASWRQLILKLCHCCREDRRWLHEKWYQQRPLIWSQRWLEQSDSTEDSDHYQQTDRKVAPLNAHQQQLGLPQSRTRKCKVKSRASEYQRTPAL